MKGWFSTKTKDGNFMCDFSIIKAIADPGTCTLSIILSVGTTAYLTFETKEDKQKNYEILYRAIIEE